jgi:hypothetical protein
MARNKKLELVVTDGARVVRLIWLQITNGRIICGSFFHPRIAMHRSYHADGSITWKADRGMMNVGDADKIFKDSGYSRDVVSGPPLACFTGHLTFLQGGFRLDSDCFESLLPYKFRAVDRLLILDSRAVRGEQRHLNFYLDLAEVGSYAVLTSRMADMQRIFTNAGKVCEHHCYLEFEPWVLMSLAYSTR